MKNLFLINSRRGQTLVEALVALSILTTGFIGIVALLNKSFQLNRTTADDTQATYLASEGVELAKNIIDYDVYYGNSSTIDWGCSFGLGSGQERDYALAYNFAPNGCSSPPVIPGATTDHLYIDPSTHLYSYIATGAATDFTRDVYITAVSSTPTQSYEFDVQSVVTWANAGASNSITLEDHFYNWYP
jgi:hypothetical protein